MRFDSPRYVKMCLWPGP